MLQIIGVWIAGFLTLAILSFLYRDNPFYKMAEHLYVGVSAGFWLIYFWVFDVHPMLITPFMTREGIDRYILLIPALLGVLMLLRWIPRVAWLSRWSIAFTFGIGAGIGLTADIQGFIIPQVRGTLLPLNTINNILVVIGVVTTILYFYFSREHKGVLGGAARIGILFVMIAFGASFGYTLMARISLLIGRMHFLFHDWIPLIK
jgi:hypothetical protein